MADKNKLNHDGLLQLEQPLIKVKKKGKTFITLIILFTC